MALTTNIYCPLLLKTKNLKLSVNWKKKKHNLKVENYVLFSELTEDCSTDSSRYYFKEVRGMPEYIGVFAREKHIYIVEPQKIPNHHTHTKKTRYLS